jgi:hypothetical protein
VAGRCWWGVLKSVEDLEINCDDDDDDDVEDNRCCVFVVEIIVNLTLRLDL